jgi:hypothetical protein
MNRRTNNMTTKPSKAVENKYFLNAEDIIAKHKIIQKGKGTIMVVEELEHSIAKALSDLEAKVRREERIRLATRVGQIGRNEVVDELLRELSQEQEDK